MSRFEPQLPTSIGRYKILRLLGSGAMGDVFLAVDPHIDRQLAIKTVRVIGGTELDIAERKQRLLREARAAGKLLHPNVVALFDADEHDGTLYLAFEYVEGVDLAQRAVSPPPLTLRQVLQLGLEVATALDYAHRLEIVHRDIKPSNILIGPGGEAKVADFGIAKLTGSTELTRTGSVVGSPQYMSPEQVRGEALDGRSDLFSLGVVLYELLCRTRPFTGDTISTLVFEILAKEPPTVDELRPGLPTRLVGTVHRLLAKDRQHRQPDGGAVAQEISALLAETPAAMLDGPAGPFGDAEGETIRMPSSGGVPAAASSSGASSSSSGTSSSRAAAPPPLPPLPRPPGAHSTATLAGPPASPAASSASHPPAPPPAPLSSGAAPLQPAPVHQAPPAAARPMPLETGTHGAKGKGPLWMVALAALVILVGLGLVAFQFLSSSEEPAPTPAEASAPAGDAPAEAAPTEARSPAAASGEPPVADRDGASSSTTTGDPAAADEPVGLGSDVAAPEPERAAVAETPPPPPPRDVAPPPSTTATPRTTAPATTAPTTTSPRSAPAPRRPPRRPAAEPSPAEAAPPQTPPAAATTDAPSAVTGAEAEFDAAAARAYGEIDTGTRLRFDVEPDNTLVKIQKRGDRSIVQGQVVRFEAGEDDARDLVLPSQGDYLVTLVHPGYPEVVYLVRAGGVTTPFTVRLSMADAARSRRAPGGPQAVRVSRGVSFAGEPADAVVFVDGERQGPASEWTGGGRGPFRSRDTLRLDRGRHTIRLEAPGHEPHEVQVVVAPSARERTFQIVYRLEKSE